MEFVQSPAFADDPSDLLHPLVSFPQELRPYAAAILRAAEILAGPLAAASRDMQHRLGFSANDLSILLIRLYEAAYGTGDADLQKACLDQWDSLLRNRVGLTAEHLRQLDD
jgi:hypothetical protein